MMVKCVIPVYRQIMHKSNKTNKYIQNYTKMSVPWALSPSNPQQQTKQTKKGP